MAFLDFSRVIWIWLSFTCCWMLDSRVSAKLVKSTGPSLMLISLTFDRLSLWLTQLARKLCRTGRYRRVTSYTMRTSASSRRSIASPRPVRHCFSAECVRSHSDSA